MPPNINVIEFFLTPGKFLHNAYVQQHYTSSNYTDVVRDGINASINVLAQQVAPSKTNPHLYSLSCNTDLFHEMRAEMKKTEAHGKKISIVAEVNANLPFMCGKVAEVKDSLFSTIIDTKNYRALFAIPREKLSIQDHVIGLYASCLIKDDSCLQIGIGKLSNALASALIFRHKNNDAYRDLLKQLHVHEKFGPLITELGSLDIFNKGLYGSTELFSDEYMQLYLEGLLKKKVYDHAGLQKLLNIKKINENITPSWIDILIENKIINPTLSAEDFHFLQEYGIFKDGLSLKNDQIILASGEIISADLNKSKEAIIKHCLGDTLKSGKILHAGFAFGSVDFYETLRNLDAEELQKIEMSSIARTNTLSWSPELLSLQRQGARFVNSSLMISLLGNAISDGLQDNQELSGVGGQHDFAMMADQLEDARSIIGCRSTRKAKNKTESNIIWDYSNITLPRYLRDIFITEYGIADCRSKTDAEIIKALLNITDSRFQETLLKQAQKSGKLPHDYKIPELYQQNYPEIVEKIIKNAQTQGYCKPYPFGSDLTQEEDVIANALLYLSHCSKIKLLALMIASFFFLRADAAFENYLQRMNLKNPKNFRDHLHRNILKLTIRHILKIQMSIKTK